MHNRFKCVVFDFDGTLADTNKGIVRAFQETFSRLGMESPSEEVLTSTIGLTLVDGFKAASPKPMTDAEAEAAATEYRRIFSEIAFPLISVFPGVKGMLAQIKDRGIGMAVATSRSHRSLEAIAQQIGVSGFFDIMCAEEDVKNHKPAPDLVNIILDRLGYSPDETLVVGDATYDLLMGRSAGCRVCGVTWGNQSREKLETAGPDYVIDTVEELANIL